MNTFLNHVRSEPFELSDVLRFLPKFWLFVFCQTSKTLSQNQKSLNENFSLNFLTKKSFEEKFNHLSTFIEHQS
jgi:hypothetical protein